MVKDVILRQTYKYKLIKNIRPDGVYYTIVNTMLPKKDGKSVHRHYNSVQQAHIMYKRIVRNKLPKCSTKQMAEDFEYITKGGKQT